MGVTFRDESNKSSSTIIGYSYATVTASNHPLIIRSKILSTATHATVHNYGVYFIIKFYLISLISGQRRKSFYKKNYTSNQTEAIITPCQFVMCATCSFICDAKSREPKPRPWPVTDSTAYAATVAVTGERASCRPVRSVPTKTLG